MLAALALLAETAVRPALAGEQVPAAMAAAWRYDQRSDRWDDRMRGWRQSDPGWLERRGHDSWWPNLEWQRESYQPRYRTWRGGDDRWRRRSHAWRAPYASDRPWRGDRADRYRPGYRHEADAWRLYAPRLYEGPYPRWRWRSL